KRACPGRADQPSGRYRADALGITRASAMFTIVIAAGSVLRQRDWKWTPWAALLRCESNRAGEKKCNHFLYTVFSLLQVLFWNSFPSALGAVRRRMPPTPDEEGETCPDSAPDTRSCPVKRLACLTRPVSPRCSPAVAPGPADRPAWSGGGRTRP